MSFIESKFGWRLRKVLRGEDHPDYIFCLRKELSSCQSILDLGCGQNSPIRHVSTLYSVGVDITAKYVQLSKQSQIHSQYIVADLLNVEFKSKTFDAVIALDAIEHLTKDQGYKLINKMEEWAKKKVIIFTPNGFLEQGPRDGNPYRIHKSGWHNEDFLRLGYSV